MAVLSNEQLKEALVSLPGWQQRDRAIARQFEFADFARAMAFVNQVAEAAEAANHHPDIDIRYNRVLLVLWSHDSGGVTERDVKLAAAINRVHGE